MEPITLPNLPILIALVLVEVFGRRWRDFGPITKEAMNGVNKTRFIIRVNRCGDSVQRGRNAKSDSDSHNSAF